MSRRAQGQLRQSQVITTYGPGALIDLPRHSAIIGGLDTWPKGLDEVVEPRLAHKLRNSDRRAGAPALRASSHPERTVGYPKRHRRLAVSGVVRRPGEQWRAAGRRAVQQRTA